MSLERIANKRFFALTIGILAIAGSPMVARGQDKPAAKSEAKSVAQVQPAAKPDAAAAEKPKAHPAFEKLKALAGEWVDAPADAAAKPGSEVKVIYRVTAAGSAVCETLLPGSAHEMVTMYHMDGDSLVLTHYCAAGNQPRMKAENSADAGKVEFKFAGGANVDPNKGLHMHEATIHFVDADHIKSRWVAYKDGKEDHAADFNLVRKK